MASSRTICGVIIIILVTALILFFAYITWWGALRPPIP
jgi:hypothetical protein